MSNIDWNKAPEGATHCIYGSIFYKVCNGIMMWYNQSAKLWELSAFKDIAELKDEYYVIERSQPEEVDMNKQVFKVGDKVYFPSRSCDLYTVEAGDVHHPLIVAGYFLKENGKQVLSSTTTIIHATPENKAMLDQLYRTEFEPLPVKLSGSDLTRTKLKETGKPILCWVSGSSDQCAISTKRVVLIVTSEESGSFRFSTSAGIPCAYAVPYTGEFLTGKDFE